MRRSVLSVLFVALLSGCAASPPTRYYDLSVAVEPAAVSLPAEVTLGIGPVTLPKVLDKPAIVSRINDSELRVANYHLWAGELKPTVTRVLASSLATRLNHDAVWASPWDNRFRPRYQVRIFVERFSGQLDGPVELALTWTLLGDYGQKAIVTERYRQRLSSQNGYVGYVGTLNQLLADFSRTLADKLATQIGQTEG